MDFHRNRSALAGCDEYYVFCFQHSIEQCNHCSFVLKRKQDTNIINSMAHRKKKIPNTMSKKGKNGDVDKDNEPGQTKKVAEDLPNELIKTHLAQPEEEEELCQVE